MGNKLKIDSKKVEYDGSSFRLIIENEAFLLKNLKEKQSEILKDLKKETANKETTSEWIENNAKELSEDIAVHIKVMAEGLPEDEQKDLLRLIMISVRNWSEDNV